MTGIKIRNVDDIELLEKTLVGLTSLRNLDLSHTKIFEQLSRSPSLLQTKPHIYHKSPPKVKYWDTSTTETKQKETNEKASRTKRKNERSREKHVRQMLFDPFGQNTNLENLNLKNTGLSDVDVLQLVSYLHKNVNLTNLNME